MPRSKDRKDKIERVRKLLKRLQGEEEDIDALREESRELLKGLEPQKIPAIEQALVEEKPSLGDCGDV